MPAGQANARGISLARTENAPSAPSSISIACSRREGRHSSRQLTDPFDQRGEFRIGTVFVAHEPAPELIVLAIEQA